jgi:dTDP-4-dehydrorhamnose reductase
VASTAIITNVCTLTEVDMDRVLIVGAAGMLGGDLLEVFQARYECIGADLPDFDITDCEQTIETITRINPGVVVNLAAFTQVDQCESDTDRAYKVNSEGAKYVALGCQAVGARCVYLSTDYVFDGLGNTPYGEDDPPHPLSIYGRSKLRGEEYLRQIAPQALIIRSSWLFSERGTNFVKTVIRLAQEKRDLEMVNDQTGSPTYTRDLSRAIYSLISMNQCGIFHVTNSGSCTWFDFARRILRQIGSSLRLIPISTAQCARPAPRPSYSVLNQAKLYSLTGIMMPPWEDALSRCISSLGVG